MINFSFKNEITDSAEDVLNRRASTPIYGTFIISWIIFHWEFLYTSFFVNEDFIYRTTGFLKNQYLVNTFINYNNWYFYFSWIMPFILTWFVIWVLPKLILLPAFEKDEEYRVSKIKIRVDLERGLVDKKTELAKSETRKFEAEEQKVIKQKKVEKIDPGILWEQEYLDFKNSPNYDPFELVLKTIYENGGYLRDSGIPTELLAYVHGGGIVELNNDKFNNRIISLTEKGKFFVEQYTKSRRV